MVPVGAVAMLLTTNAKGVGTSPANSLPYGTYEVTELRIDSVAEIGKELVMGSHKMANNAYLWKEQSFRFQVREDGKIYQTSDKEAFVFENEPEKVKTPVLFKYDLNLGTNKTQGGASFEGIRFALINRSRGPVFVAYYNEIFLPGQVMDVITSTAEGIIELPYTIFYGTYGLMELSTLSTVAQGDMIDALSDAVKFGVSEDRLGQLYANASYMYTDREEKSFKAVTLADGHVEYDTDLLHFDNKLVRGGIYFEKKVASTQEHLPYVVFKLTLKETGETHYIMTNHNAYYGTDQLYNKHSNNTNGIDAIVAPYAEKGFIPQAIIDELIAKEAWNWGTWFGTAPVTDEDYALPLGSYDLEEIKSPANEKFFLYRNDDFKIWYNHQYHSFGTIFNRELGILTDAVDAKTKTREGFAIENATILDTVTYNGLVPGASYELVASLVAKNAEGVWATVKGIEVHKTFIPKLANHFEVMEIAFDATPYEDADVVVFEELRDANGAIIAEHKSLTDAKQTIRYKPVPVSSMTIEKKAISEPKNGMAYLKGEEVKYQITVTNPGKMELNHIQVIDALIGFQDYIASLKPGKSRSFTVNYRITEEDSLAGKFYNEVTASCEDPTATPEDPKTALTVKDDETVPAMTFKPGYEQNKNVVSEPRNGIAYVEGEVITFKLSLKNTGNQPLSITVKDELADFEEEVKLAPGETWEKEVFYTVTKADTEAGHVLNVLTSKGIPPAYPDGEPNEPIIPEDKKVEVPAIAPKAHVSINKDTTSQPAVGVAYMKGETITYRITVVNDGNMDLSDVLVEDTMLGLAETLPTLAVGEKAEFNLSYLVNEEDARAGHILNLATVTAPNPNAPNDKENPTLTDKDDEENPATLCGTVTVIHVDENGKVLIKKEVVVNNAPVGTPYETAEKEIPGYHFKKMDDKSAPKTGKVVEGSQAVIYVYQKERAKEPEPQTTVPASTPAPVTTVLPPTGDPGQLHYFCLVMIICGASLAIILVRGKDGET